MCYRCNISFIILPGMSAFIWYPTLYVYCLYNWCYCKIMCFRKLFWPLQVTKGQIWGGSLCLIDVFDENQLCARFHAFIQKCTKKVLAPLLYAYFAPNGPYMYGISHIHMGFWLAPYAYGTRLIFKISFLKRNTFGQLSRRGYSIKCSSFSSAIGN